MSDREPHLTAFHDHAALLDHTPGEPPPAVPRPDGGGESLAERLTRLRDDPRVVAAAVAAVALVAGLVFYRSALGAGGAPPVTVASGPTTSTGTVQVVVHVSGAVAAAGVYRLPPGARVADAVEAAGGTVEGADPDRLNLAALVGDGQRVHVPRVGEPVVAAAADGGAPADGTTGPLDLNFATIEQLEALPGIGPSLAQAIVDERERRGGFRRVDDLLAVRGIGEKRFADLRDLVTV